MTPEVYIDYLNKFDVEKVALTNTEILTAIEESLAMQGKGETEIEPRMHIRPVSYAHLTLPTILLV